MVFYSKQRRQRRSAFKKSYPTMSKIMQYAPKLLPSGYDSAARWGVKRLQELVNTEFDYLDSNATGNITAGGSLALINGLSQGDTASSREGNSIRMKSIQLKYTATVNATAGTNFLRIMLVQDKQANGAAPAVTDVLATNTVTSPRNLDNRKRFKVLYDQVHCLSTNASPIQYKENYIKNMQTHVSFYNGSNLGTVADIATNAFYILALSDNSTNSPSLSRYVRIRFIDN